MKPQLQQKPLSVKPSRIQGYGVFAEADIESGTVIEECPVIMCRLRSPDLDDYQFQTDQKDVYALALGYGSIYNHAPEPNAAYKYHADHSLVIFTALKPIKKNQEILVNYGPAWFSSRKITVIEYSWWAKLRRCKPYFEMILRFAVVAGVLASLIYIFHS